MVKKFLICLAFFFIANLIFAQSLDGQGYGQIVIIHDASGQIVEIFMKKSGETNWGSSYINSPMVGPDRRHTITLPPGFYDIKIIGKNLGAYKVSREDIVQNVWVREYYIVEILSQYGLYVQPHKRME
jgi:hypothetical protein